IPPASSFLDRNVDRNEYDHSALGPPVASVEAIHPLGSIRVAACALVARTSRWGDPLVGRKEAWLGLRELASSIMVRSSAFRGVSPPQHHSSFHGFGRRLGRLQAVSAFRWDSPFLTLRSGNCCSEQQR